MEDVTSEEVQDKDGTTLQELIDKAAALGKTVVSTKSLIKSKTFWVNVIAFGLGAIQYMTGSVVNAEIIVGVLPLVNIVLRYINNDISGLLK